MSLVRKLVGRLTADTKGSVAMVFSLVAPLLVLAAGYGIDIAVQVKANASLQSVADSAAIAAARELALANSDPSQIQIVALNHANENAKNARVISRSGAKLSVKAKIVDNFTGVQVDVKQSWEPMFGGLVGNHTISTSVTATAHLVGSTKICVLGLMDEGILAGVHLDNKAQLTAENCGVYSNSKSFASIRADSDSEMTAGLICAAGGTMETSSVSYTPTPITDCPQIPDPLAQRAPPPVGSCLENDLVITADATLSPGTYCGGITIKGKASVELEPGVYVIKDGPLSVEDKARFEGEYVGFYMVGDGSTFSFAENTEVSIGAPKDGPLAGLLFFEVYDSAIAEPPQPKFSLFSALSDLTTLAKMRTHRIKSNNARQLLGTIYLPNSILQIDADAPVADESAYTAVVVRRLWLLEGPHLVLNSDYGATDVPIPSSLAGAQTKLTK